MTLAEPTTSLRGDLAVRAATVRYGGLTALDAFDLRVRGGSITGVIGPNGSGKSTLINIVAGITPVDSGSVVFEGADVTGLTVPKRASIGIARTFQAIRLFDSMSVLENVLIGATRNYRSSLAASVFRTPRLKKDDEVQRELAMEILASFGNRLLPRLSHPVGTLSYANRRRVEITRAFMLQPSLLLLDEPMAGMNPHESWELAEQLPGLLRDRDCSALIVEHKMDIITHLCSDVYVLDHGVEIAHGSPRDVVKDPAVEEAFLGIE
ncbi:ABC transporter ATP-binding protein [Agreia sp. PsM10]|uniref:ABC transporter ATP-binding protein n=1 Tax=Agreia sp. PsM10 TaxID=3030533 RepID=UPI00263B70A0|nr:ABC transporter ATP-binding protein [Agreia sp. PsM10]MDN4641051.1 ABC transporter ATP-binding protein [Agreia sp. PsM10]